MESAARVVKEGYWTVVVRRNDNDDEVYEAQDTYEDHWPGMVIAIGNGYFCTVSEAQELEILEMQARGYSRPEAIEIVLQM